MSKITELASGQITTTDSVKIELSRLTRPPLSSSLRGRRRPASCIRIDSRLPLTCAHVPSRLLWCGWHRSRGSGNCEGRNQAEVSPEAKQFVWFVIDFLIVRLPALLANGRAACEGQVARACSTQVDRSESDRSLWIRRTSIIM